MNKFSKLFCGLAALVMFASCSNDDPTPAPDPVPGDGTRAFMTIRLQDASEFSSRATTNGGYENAVAEENAVNDARFFFFDENGVFVSEASVWNGGNWNPAPGVPGQNIEFKGNTVIVLENLTSNTYPKYMLTVLNAPDFNPESTIEATAASIQMQSLNKIGDKNYFVMSTSSYWGEKSNKDDKYYYANKLEGGNFLLQPVDKEPTVDDITDATKVVDVYVERLASKVQLDMTKLENETSTYTDENGKTYTTYKVSASVAGNPNDEGDINEGATDVYVAILGWDINATAKNTYLSKQLKEGWKTTDPFTGWANANDYRCFWASSWVYNQEVGTDNLNYKGWSVLGKKINGTADDDLNVRYAYCNENTNTPDKIMSAGKVDPSKVTSVLVKAVACDKNGNALDLVRHNGILYNKADYLQYVLNSIDMGKGNLNVYYLDKIIKTRTFTAGVPDVDAENKPVYNTKYQYKQIDKSFAKLDRVGNKIAVYSAYTAETLPSNTVTTETWDGTSADALVKTETTEESDAYYTKSGETYTAYADKQAVVTYITSALSTKQATMTAEAFTGGAMYYTIPIEHLAASLADAEVTDEGYYGVVRNHWYRLTINTLVNIGHGVFNPGDGSDEDPGDPIIPVVEPDRYYLAAKINILSWKIVSQNVPL